MLRESIGQIHLSMRTRPKVRLDVGATTRANLGLLIDFLRLGFWSLTTVLQPYCVFSLENAQEVAHALSIFRSTNTQFAVRSNGHMTVKGAASTNQGVLLALTRFRQMEICSDHSIASIGPGLTWFEVYNWIQQYDRAVLGGRYAPVGVSGHLLGGGISFYSGQYGWAANNIRNYEVVTADSQIINVNATSHKDLFWALKGGSSNFGIVTRFDLITRPGSKVYAGTVEYSPSGVSQLIEALGSFVSLGGGIDDPSTAILPNVVISPGTGVMTANAFIFNNGNQTSSLQSFTDIKTVSNSAKIRNYDFVAETVWSGNRSFRYVKHRNVVGLKQSYLVHLVMYSTQQALKRPDKASTSLITRSAQQQ